MVEIVIMEAASAHYAQAIASRHPALRVHTAPTAAAALACCANADVLVAMAPSIPAALLQAMPRLRWVQALTTGVDNLLTLPELPKDVLLTSARGIHGPQMAELAFLFMLSLSRNFPAMLANQTAAKWQRWPQKLLLGRTAVIVGVGTISEDLAARCKAFGMRVVGISDSRIAAPGFDTIMPRARLTAAAAEADFLMVLVPADASTRKLIGPAVLAAMKPDAFLVNLARGSVVDEAALAEALLAHRIAGAALDVFEVEPAPPDNPFWAMPNVIMTPHIGGMSDIYAQQVLPTLLDNLAAYIDGRYEDMRNVVPH